RGGRPPGCARFGASGSVRALPASGFARGSAERRVREHPGSARRLRTADRAGNTPARDPQRCEALRHAPPRRALRSLPSPPGLPQHAPGRGGPLTGRLASRGLRPFRSPRRGSWAFRSPRRGPERSGRLGGVLSVPAASTGILTTEYVIVTPVASPIVV